MKPNNVIYLKCTEDSFYRMWMEFLTPFHKLTAREKDVAARILLQYFKFKGSVSDPDVLKELLWSRSSRNDMLVSLKMSQPHFQMVVKKLEMAGILKDNEFNPRYIPHKIPGDSRFMLQIVYDWSSPKTPIIRSEEQT